MQAAKLAKREMSEDKDPRRPLEGATRMWQVSEVGKEGWVIAYQQQHQTVPQLTHLQWS